MFCFINISLAFILIHRSTETRQLLHLCNGALNTQWFIYEPAAYACPAVQLNGLIRAWFTGMRRLFSLASLERMFTFILFIKASLTRGQSVQNNKAMFSSLELKNANQVLCQLVQQEAVSLIDGGEEGMCQVRRWKQWLRHHPNLLLLSAVPMPRVADPFCYKNRSEFPSSRR